MQEIMCIPGCSMVTDRGEGGWVEVRKKLRVGSIVKQVPKLL